MEGLLDRKQGNDLLYLIRKYQYEKLMHSLFLRWEIAPLSLASMIT